MEALRVRVFFLCLRAFKGTSLWKTVADSESRLVYIIVFLK